MSKPSKSPINISGAFENTKDRDVITDLLGKHRLPVDYLHILPVNHGKSNTDAMVALWERMREAAAKIDVEQIHREIKKHVESRMDESASFIIDSCPTGLFGELPHPTLERAAKTIFFSNPTSYFSDFCDEHYLHFPRDHRSDWVDKLTLLKERQLRGEKEFFGKHWRPSNFRFIVDELTRSPLKPFLHMYPKRHNLLACYADEIGFLRRMDESKAIVGIVSGASFQFLPPFTGGVGITYSASQVGKSNRVANPEMCKVGRPHLATYMRCRHAKQQRQY